MPTILNHDLLITSPFMAFSRSIFLLYEESNYFHLSSGILIRVMILTFGIWVFGTLCVQEMTPDADVISTRYTKSVIKSCAAMSYVEAQARMDDRCLLHRTFLGH